MFLAALVISTESHNGKRRENNAGHHPFDELRSLRTALMGECIGKRSSGECEQSSKLSFLPVRCVMSRLESRPSEEDLARIIFSTRAGLRERSAGGTWVRARALLAAVRRRSPGAGPHLPVRRHL